MKKDLAKMTPKGVALWSLGFAAFVAKRRKSPGLDLRGQGVNMATTPKGSHNKNNVAIVRHLRSRPLHAYIFRRSRPAVMRMRPLWGLFSIRLFVKRYIISNKFGFSLDLHYL